MFKNVATKIQVVAYDYTTGAFKTGDAANITVYVSKDAGSATVLTDTSGAELDATNAKGVYTFDVTATECNADDLLFTGKSSTANVQIVPVRLATIDLSLYGVVTKGTAQGGTSTTIQLASATNLNADNNPAGFTVFIKAGTGAGQARAFISYVNSTDTATVLAWTTTPASDSEYVVFATAPFSATDVSVSATSVRTALGMASANLDTQIAAVQADTDNIQTRLPAVLNNGYISASLDAFEGVAATGDGSSGNNIRPTGIAVS